MERERTPGPHVTEQPCQGLVLYAHSVTVGERLGSGLGEGVGSGVRIVGQGVGTKLGSGVGSDGVPVGLGQGGTIEQGVVEDAQSPQRPESTACGDSDVTSVHFLLMVCIPWDGTSPAARHVLEHPVLAASMH